MFADDIKLYRRIRSPIDCCILQTDINILLDWYNHWLLSFNASKCKALHIGNTPYIHLNGTQLELLNDFHDLSIQIDSKLKFHKHTYRCT